MQLEPTGERMVEEFYRNSAENYLIYLFHKATYNFSKSYVVGRRILDYGCGSGYGTHHMSAYCDSIVGVDIAADAIEYARAHYRADNLSYRCIEPADSSPLPFDDASFDTVLSFQVIEHLEDVAPYLSEIRRVLTPGGIFVCATPDRSTRLLPGQKPWNMWHIREYDVQGLKRTLSTYFPAPELLQMGGRPDVLNIELRRTRKLMWLMLPVTLPIVPEGIRVAILKLLKRLAGQSRRAPELTAMEFSFDESNLTIAAGLTPSVNLIAIARKP